MSARRLWPILVLAALLGLANAYATPAFWPVDETAHVAYADQLVRTGRLPTIDSPIPEEMDYPGLAQRLAWDEHQNREGRKDIWTANHPPLPYLVQGVALVAGDAVGGGRTALGLARLTSVVWLVLGVWGTARLAFLLAPTATSGQRRGLRPHEVAYAAAALVAVTPTLSHLAGLVFNDVPAFTLSTLSVLLGARAAFSGLTPRRLASMGLLAGAAALTRISCLPAVAIMVALGLYAWWRDPQAMRQPGAGRAWLVSALALLPAGAFWIRNIALYGDPTAAGALFEKFDRDLNDPVAVLLGDRFFWYRLWNRMWADLTTGHWAVGLRADITVVGLVVVALATAVALWRAVRHLRDVPRRRRAAQRLAGRRTPDRRLASAGAGLMVDLGDDRGAAGLPEQLTLPGWAARSHRLQAFATALAAHPRRVVWAVAALLPLALLVSAIQFHSAGGSLHGRYLLGGHAVVATAIVLVLAGLPLVGRPLALLSSVPIFVVNVALVQSLMIHHSRIWDRPGIRLVLPSVAGDVGSAIATGLVGIASVVLLVILAQHAVGRRDGHAPPATAPQTPPSPRREIKESAAR